MASFLWASALLISPSYSVLVRTPPLLLSPHLAVRGPLSSLEFFSVSESELEAMGGKEGQAEQTLVETVFWPEVVDGQVYMDTNTGAIVDNIEALLREETQRNPSDLSLSALDEPLRSEPSEAGSRGSQFMGDEVFPSILPESETQDRQSSVSPSLPPQAEADECVSLGDEEKGRKARAKAQESKYAQTSIFSALDGGDEESGSEVGEKEGVSPPSPQPQQPEEQESPVKAPHRGEATADGGGAGASKDKKKKKKKKKQKERSGDAHEGQPGQGDADEEGEDVKIHVKFRQVGDSVIVTGFEGENLPAYELARLQQAVSGNPELLKSMDQEAFLKSLGGVLHQTFSSTEGQAAIEIAALQKENQKPVERAEGSQTRFGTFQAENTASALDSSLVSSLPESSSVDPSSSKKKKKKKKPDGKPEGKQRPPLCVLQEEALRLGLELQPLPRAPPGEQGEDLLNPLEIQGVPMPRLMNLAVSAFYDLKGADVFTFHFPELSSTSKPGASVPKGAEGVWLLDPLAGAYMMTALTRNSLLDVLKEANKFENLISPFKLSAGDLGRGGRESRGTKAEGFLSNKVILYTEWDPRIVKMYLHNQLASELVEGVGFWVGPQTSEEKLYTLLKNSQGRMVVASQEPMRRELFEGNVLASEVLKGEEVGEPAEGAGNGATTKGDGWEGDELKPGYGEFFPLCSLTPSSSPRKSAALLVNFLNSPRLEQRGNQRSLWLFFSVLPYSTLKMVSVPSTKGKVVRVREENTPPGRFLTSWN